MASKIFNALVVGVFILMLAGCAMDSTGIWGAMGVVPTDAERKATRRQAYVAAHPTLSAARRSDILAGDLVTGMTPGEAVASWGQPYKVNSSGGRYGAREQWLYGFRDPYRYSRWITTHYIYFEDGELSSWQRVGR